MQNIDSGEHEYCFIKTNGENIDFVCMCVKLDEYLDGIVGEKKQRAQYTQYNTLDSIHDVILIYDNDIVVGSGAYKIYDKETVEMKRIYIDEPYRGLGLGDKLMLYLEADAREKEYQYAILETGAPLVAATCLYKKRGYTVIPNYGQYKDMPESVCMKKTL